ncbi:MAG: transposase [Lewinellaceae bacterium]|nr:transposase [Lewinellaceae bacterium]
MNGVGSKRPGLWLRSFRHAFQNGPTAKQIRWPAHRFLLIVRVRRSITKNGSSKIRALLFNCARSAMRYNPNCKALYERLIEKGKNGKVALTAVMHKLARLIFGVVRSGRNYDPNFVKN